MSSDNPLLKANLDNIDVQYDLFGQPVKKLSMADRLGFLPISIWQPDWAKVKELKAIIGDFGQTRAIDQKSANARGGKTFRQTKTSYNTALGNRDNDLSIFNPHLAQMILAAYCPTNANIYDPYGGGGTRGFVARAMGHNYTGVEIRQEEVDRILEKQKELNLGFNIICGDSGSVTIDKGMYDFSYTCPPYFNLEIYSDLPGDTSYAKDYDTFLSMTKPAIQVNYDALKPGSLAVWVVGNFRDKDGYLVHFNGDLIRLAQDVGFKLHDELIWWGAAGSAVQRAGQFEANRKSVRVHEYVLIFKKP